MIFSNQLGKLDGYTSEEAVRTIANHIRKMQEEMEYRLMTLDSSNISEISLDETKVLLKGQPLQNVLQDNEGMSVLEQKVNELRATVADVSGNYTTLSVAVSGLQSTVSGYQTAVDGYAAQVSTFNQTVSGFNTTVSKYQSAVNGYAAQVSEFNQEAEAIYGVVSDLQDDVGHMLKLDSNGVYIVDNKGNTVSIHGGQIDASTVTASKLKGNTISVMLGDVTYAKMSAESNTDGRYAFELNGVGGIRLHGEYGNVYLQSYSLDDRYSAHITIGNNYVSIGGELIVSSKNYGTELPDGGEEGQVFFLLQ